MPTAYHDSGNVPPHLPRDGSVQQRDGSEESEDDSGEEWYPALPHAAPDMGRAQGATPIPGHALELPEPLRTTRVTAGHHCNPRHQPASIADRVGGLSGP